MTAHKDLKSIIRARQEKTGESYTTARMHVLAQRAPKSPVDGNEDNFTGAVLKVNARSARLRPLGRVDQVTFRCEDAFLLVPGQVVDVQVDKRWTWRGDAYASGRLDRARVDLHALGLEPLTLTGGELDDPREWSEPYDGRDAYSKLWRSITAKPKPAFEFDAIAWGELPGYEDPDDNLTCRASELREEGRHGQAQDLLMKALGIDLRCLDAHAHLGKVVFDHAPDRAIIHYEIGVRIGELSLPKDADIYLPWSRLYNRPFLRCLSGLGLCEWRLGRFDDALATFERILRYNPNDNQGIRFCWADARKKKKWRDDERAAEA